MRKYIVLTSILALTACGGGGGSGGPSGHAAHPTTPTNPTVNIQGFNGGTEVNSNNASLTNMSSYVMDFGTDEDTTKGLMVAYVNSKLGTASRGGILNRAASNQANRDTVDPTEFARADAAIAEMKQVLYDMVGKPDDATLKTYVARYRYAVVNALKMQDAAVTSETPIDDLVAAFNALKDAEGWTTENIVAKMDTFDQNNFDFTKYRMEDDVQLKDTGQDAYFKFDLDEGGAIKTVSLWESPTSEYGTSWTADGAHGHDVKVVINDSGDAVAVYDDGLNPFGADYLNSAAGYLNRQQNGNRFTNTIHHYNFDLGEHTLGAGAIIDSDEFEEVEIDTTETLTPELAKQKLKDYIIEKVNKKMHNQNGGENDGDVAKFVAVANWYIDRIDEIVNATLISESFVTDIAQSATMNGMGKDVGLRYSDFGYAKMVRTVPEHNPETQYLTYVGGYNGYKADKRPMANGIGDATFTGTAVVTVEDHHKNKNTHSETTNTALYKDTSATLTYYPINPTNAEHTLVMNNLTAMDIEGNGATAGSDWYNVSVTRSNEGSDMIIAYNSTGKDIDENFQFFRADSEGNITRNEADGIAAINQIVRTDGTSAEAINMTDGTTSAVESHHRLNGTADASYYGPTQDDVTEATAGVWMDERWATDDNNIQHELSVYGAFGGQKNE